MTSVVTDYPISHSEMGSVVVMMREVQRLFCRAPWTLGTPWSGDVMPEPRNRSSSIQLQSSSSADPFSITIRFPSAAICFQLLLISLIEIPNRPQNPLSISTHSFHIACTIAAFQPHSERLPIVLFPTTTTTPEIPSSRTMTRILMQLMELLGDFIRSGWIKVN